MADRWRVARAGPRLTLARRWPPRFDLDVAATMPADRSRLWRAQALRRDLWRALAGLRGFSPVVEVLREDGLFRIRLGGRVEGRPLGRDARARAEATVARVLQAQGATLR